MRRLLYLYWKWRYPPPPVCCYPSGKGHTLVCVTLRSYVGKRLLEDNVFSSKPLFFKPPSGKSASEEDVDE